MEVLLSSFFLVFFSEIGDKTQLLTLLLITKYRRPYTILAAIFLATLLNHAFAAYVGQFVIHYVPPQFVKWILASLFFSFAIWVLFPDDEEALSAKKKFGVFMTTLVTFFLAEMGDKTQLATVALGARYEHFLAVTAGSTFGLLGSNALVVFLGKKYLNRIPKKWIFRLSSFLFFIFGLGILLDF